MEKTCKERVEKAFNSRMTDIRKLYEADNQETAELGSLNDYGLSIDKVEADTFKNQVEPFLRYQISWGGPSEEFRIYPSGKIEFWFLDWYDGASVEVTGEDKAIINDIVLSVVKFN